MLQVILLTIFCFLDELLSRHSRPFPLRLSLGLCLCTANRISAKLHAIHLLLFPLSHLSSLLTSSGRSRMPEPTERLPLPILHPLLNASQKIGAIPTLIDPPWGRLKKLWLMRLKAPAKDTKIIISASVLVDKNRFFACSVLCFFPPPALPGSGSLGRQHLSRPLSQVAKPQLPVNLEGNMLFSRIIVSYHGSDAVLTCTCCFFILSPFSFCCCCFVDGRVVLNKRVCIFLMEIGTYLEPIRDSLQIPIEGLSETAFWKLFKE